MAVVAGIGEATPTGAITGGIVAAHTGTGPGRAGAVPEPWLTAREPLPHWFDPDRRPPRPKVFARIRRRLSGGS